MKKCLNCGEMQNNNAKFCNVCGSDSLLEVEEQTPSVCRSCGKELKSGAKFCVGCGAVIEPETDGVNAAQLPVTAEEVVNVKVKTNKNRLYVILCICAVFLLIVGTAVGVLLYMNLSSGNEKTADTPVDVNVKNDTTEKDVVEIEAETTTNNSTQDLYADAEDYEGESNMLRQMNAEEICELNLFLSNFSEALYLPDSWDEEERKIAFAYRHNVINNQNFQPLRSDNYTGISVDVLDKTLNRFFGKSVSHKTPDSFVEWFYRDDAFWHIESSGDAITYFTAADSLQDNLDGTFTVRFSVYYYPEDDMGGERYYISKKKADEIYEHEYDGTAIVKPKKHNGEYTYELVEYDTEN